MLWIPTFWERFLIYVFNLISKGYPRKNQKVWSLYLLRIEIFFFSNFHIGNVTFIPIYIRVLRSILMNEESENGRTNWNIAKVLTTCLRAYFNCCVLIPVTPETPIFTSSAFFYARFSIHIINRKFRVFVHRICLQKRKYSLEEKIVRIIVDIYVYYKSQQTEVIQLTS